MERKDLLDFKDPAILKMLSKVVSTPAIDGNRYAFTSICVSAPSNIDTQEHPIDGVFLFFGKF